MLSLWLRAGRGLLLAVSQSRSLSVALLLFMTAAGAGLSRLAPLYSGRIPGAFAELSPFLLPIGRSWPAVNVWNEQLEAEYSQFVERLGQSVAAHRCRTLDACLRSPESNLLFDPWTDPKLELDVDCGDLPYVLRGYFSFKRRLPFGFVCGVQGVGPHVRYMADVTPSQFCRWDAYGSPRAALRKMIGQVHSGMYRMAPEVEGSDFYPAAISRLGVRPGTVYYDPNGHVLVVAEVRGDGSVYLMDGHPDGSLTWKRFGEAFALGGRGQGGGFKNFRPQRLVAGNLVRAANSELPLLDGRSQWNRSLWQAAGRPGSYHAWVRQTLAEPGAPKDPVADFREQVRALCRDIAERLEAVDAATEAGLQLRSHPGALPDNIYGTVGDWEVYATPSRDARLKAAFRELYGTVSELVQGTQLGPELSAAWQQEAGQPTCRFAYRNSTEQSVPLALADILDRLFLLSFDPYHCPELRWGATPGSAEAASCPADPVKLDFYLREQRLRNRIDREYGEPTPLSEGPLEPPELDVRRLLGIPASAPPADEHPLP